MDNSIEKERKEFLEIERKYLVKEEVLRSIIDSFHAMKITQGYLVKSEKGSVRIRIEEDLTAQIQRAYLMSKTNVNYMSNIEIPPQEISISSAQRLLNDFCKKTIIKTRYVKYYNGKKWEVDLFHTPNEGLLLAEIELESADETIELPDWIDREVTGQPEYYNVNM